MRIGNVEIWRSASQAKTQGAIHSARFMGIIPGFYGEDNSLWISRSDLLNPIEDALVWVWVTMREMRGEEPDFMFDVGRPI